ncbi:hypothetical protein GF345_05380 [Candidatus Woesearchaeota archaeon]|nr:hypothetical protein [Candidatus Woesearchaeota archaeon]
MEEHGCGCCGGHEAEKEFEAANEDDEELSVEEQAEEADNKVDALVELLVKKGIITEDEFDKAYDDLFEDEGSESPE